MIRRLTSRRPSVRRVTRPTAALMRTVALTLTAVLTLGACGSSASSSTPGAPGASRTASSSGSASPTSSAPSPAVATPSATSGSASTPPTATARIAQTTTATEIPACATAELRLSARSAGGAAGTAYTFYGLTNSGSARCSLIGYPGVAVLDAAGRIVQHPARRGADLPSRVRRVILRPGQTARFLVNSTDVIPSPGCQRSYGGTTLQVFPPNQRAAIRQPYTGTFCNLRVGPVQRGG